MRPQVARAGARGHEGGEVASRVVTDALLAKFGAESAFGARALLCYVDYASAQLGLARQDQPALADMSTTVAALLGGYALDSIGVAALAIGATAIVAAPVLWLAPRIPAFSR